MKLSRVWWVSFVVSILGAGAATGSPGIDVAATADDCSANIVNPELRGGCTKCVATKGKHYHYGLSLCHATNAAAPKPPAKLESSGMCQLYYGAPASKATLDKCVACLDGTDANIWAGGTCKPEPDPDPAKMATKPVLDGASCSIAAAGATANRALFEQCSTCVKKGGTFHVKGGGCKGPTIAETTANLSEAKQCRNRELVAPERRMLCKQCLAKGYNAFAVAGDKAGTCVRDDWKFVDRFKLPEESSDKQFLYKEGSCTRNVTDTRKQLACIACINKKGDVFVGGTCLQPDAAAKKARALQLPPAEKPAAAEPPPVPASEQVTVKPGQNLIVNGGFETTEMKELIKGRVAIPAEWGLMMQSLIDNAVALRDAGAHTGKNALELAASTSVSIEAKLQPSKRYRLAFWVKATGIAATAKLTPMIEIGTQRPYKVRKVAGTPITAAADWTQVTLDVDASASESYAQVRLSAAMPDKGSAFLVDDVELMLAP